MSDIDAATDQAAETNESDADQAAETNESDADQATEAVTDAPAEPADEGEQPKDREAARYRKRLRDTETERDRLAERLTVMQRADAERQAGQRLGKGADLWAGGVELSTLLDDDGNLSPELLEQAVSGVIAAHPHWKRSGAPPASAVTGSDVIGPNGAASFTDAFRPPDKR